MLILYLLAGLALLLGGLFLMRYGLRQLFSRRLQLILARATHTPGRGMAAGIIGAALMQSSTALTLITIGLVSAEYMSFYQGLGIILGANIGTCSTVGLLTLNLSAGRLLPLLAAGALTALVVRRVRFTALALTGMLAMFSGVSLLSDALAALSEVATVVRWLAAAGNNPLYGIGAGIVLTFLFQSSSAATGLLMTLAGEGAIGITAAAYGVYGNNIGSCLSSVLIGTTAPLAAKRVAMSHIVLNILGVMAFLPFTGLLTKAVLWLTPEFAAQVAVLHAVFNIVSSLAVVPVIRPFAALIAFLVPGDGGRG
ncbi:MAG TPA: Na/Pi symporter [Selenomonadales bacterium]|nr:Na/Pi symporter [Selenomonadales bacterium]